MPLHSETSTLASHPTTMRLPEQAHEAWRRKEAPRNLRPHHRFLHGLMRLRSFGLIVGVASPDPKTMGAKRCVKI